MAFASYYRLIVTDSFDRLLLKTETILFTVTINLPVVLFSINLHVTLRKLPLASQDYGFGLFFKAFVTKTSSKTHE